LFLYIRHSDKSKVSLLLRRLFLHFMASVFLFAFILLTVLTFIPKINRAHVTNFELTGRGIVKSDIKTSPDYDNMKYIIQALEQYLRDNGNYPTNEQGLLALLEKPSHPPVPMNWQGPYLKRALIMYKDKPKHEYVLERFGDRWIYSLKLFIKEKPFLKTEKTRKKHVLEVEIRHALVVYRTDNGRYPTNEQGLGALIAKPTLAPIPDNWNGPYIDGELKNDKGRPYYYTLEESGGIQRYRIYTK
jgi:type II secretion system protein G